MASAYPSPVLVPAGRGPAQVLERVPLSGDASRQYSEKWLQDLVYQHPTTLPVTEIDSSFDAIVPLCEELPTPAGPIDVAYVTRDGRLVLVEAKLWRNPEARRKVIGQVLDYAKELSQWDVEQLNTAVLRARHTEDHGNPRGLLALLGIDPESAEAAAFHDALARNLRRGEMLLVIVGDGIREGVGQITDFLERQGTLHFTFGLVEMAIHELPGGGGQLVQPRVLAQSTIVRRTVVEVRHDGLRLTESQADSDLDEAPDEEASPTLLENRRRFQAFWRGFLDVLHLDDARQEIKPPARAQNQYFMLPKATAAWVSPWVAESQHRAGVHLTFYRGPIADRLYASLLEERRAIEGELGLPLDWRSQDGKHMISLSREYPGAFVSENPGPVQHFLADWTNRFLNVFRPRLERLARELT